MYLLWLLSAFSVFVIFRSAVLYALKIIEYVQRLFILAAYVYLCHYLPPLFPVPAFAALLLRI